MSVEVFEKIEPDYKTLYTLVTTWLHEKGMLSEFEELAKARGFQTQPLWLVPAGTKIVNSEL